MWIIWTITIPIWLVCIVVFLVYAIFDEYGKVIVRVANVAEFIFFLLAIWAVVRFARNIYRGIFKKDVGVDVLDDLKYLVGFGVYVFVYGSLFIQKYLM